MKKTICNTGECTACKACMNVCSKKAITIDDSIMSCNAVIDTEKCISCGLCKKICPSINTLHMQKPIYWKQGWAENDIRRNSSSGGAASAIMLSFIKSGGYVASCLFNNGDFVFKVTNRIDDAKKFAGSKYVKSNPGEIYIEIKKLLNRGEKVLFLGLPCQVAAVQNFCANHKELYTADLICHGTPSSKLLMKYLDEQGIGINSVSEISFRDKENWGLSTDGGRIVPKRAVDSYLLTFLDSINYTDNCYSCRYASINRVSDITLGDAWGQLADKVKGGVSLILCQTEKGISLIEHTNLHLEDVDLEKAVDANHQLRHPSYRHPSRDRFMKSIISGHSYKWATFISLPLKTIKQSIKVGLIKLNLLDDRQKINFDS